MAPRLNGIVQLPVAGCCTSTAQSKLSWPVWLKLIPATARIATSIAKLPITV